MSIDEQHAGTQPAVSEREVEDRGAAYDAASPSEPRGKRWYTGLLSPLWLCLLVALALRIWLTVRTHGVLDGDEALLGIQAEHILQGERPIYFYGIPYFGSLEAYIVALLFAVFGPSVAVLRAETTAFCLLLVALTWWLASLLAKAAHLPPYARRSFTIVAALIAALPPLYDVLVELRTGGGWIESFVLMLLLLIAAYRLTTRWHEGASGRELLLRWAGIGLIVGFGMWIYPLVIMAILAAALWIAGDRLVEIIKLKKASVPLMSAIGRSLKKVLPVVIAIPACLVGFAPGLIWGAMNRWENIHFLFSAGGGASGQRLITIALVTTRYGACVAPRVISGATPLETPPLTFIHIPLLLAGVLCIGFTVALALGSLRWSHPLLLQARRLVTLPALMAGSSALLFCISSASASILISCRDDFGGHYAAPLVLALPFFFATAFVIAAMFINERRSRQQPESAANETPARPQHGAPTRPFIRPAFAGLLLLLVLYLGGQAATYGLTDPDQAFQSPYCTIAPAHYEPIIAYMEQQHIRYAWASNLLGYQITFETNNRIILADPLAVMHPDISINRIPAYTNAVAHADRPSMLVFVKHGDPHPYLLRLLDSAHVTYKVAFFPSEPGIDVMIVTPLNRTVSPFESQSFDIFYCSPR